MDVGEWKTTIKNLTRAITMDFLLFICENYSVKSWSSTELYIRQFQQLYTTVTGQYMDRNDAKEVYKVRQLCSLYKLIVRALIAEVSS